jgi:hypothetical protein
MAQLLDLLNLPQTASKLRLEARLNITPDFRADLARIR